MKIIAHRSGPTQFPEQTIASARLALKNGADMVEIDVRFTADRKLAVSHDDNANRVFGTDKNVSEMTETEFLSLRHKNNREFSSHLFEDYLRCGIAPLLIHIKQDEVLEELLNLIDNYGYADKVVIGAQSTGFTRAVKEHNPNIKVLAFMPGNGADDSVIDKFTDAGADYIRLWQHWLNKDNAAKVRSTGKELWIMSNGKDVGVPTDEGICKIKEFNPEGILINDVTRLR